MNLICRLVDIVCEWYEESRYRAKDQMSLKWIRQHLYNGERHAQSYND